MNIPESMRSELAAWNNGSGIDLESWVGCVGNFSLAVGYAAIFWPEFIEFEGYILRKNFSEATLRAFERRNGEDKKSTEAVMNHLHIADIQYVGCPDLSRDKIIVIGNVLSHIYRVKLSQDFPRFECAVEFECPEDRDDLVGYQMTFWRLRPR